jgi:hypothetical protein
VEDDGSVGTVLLGAGHDQAADPTPAVEVMSDLPDQEDLFRKIGKLAV